MLPNHYGGSMIKLRKLTPEEELRYLMEIHGKDNYSKLFEILIKHFEVLQNRAQLLLSLVAITLTITGFSGPQIASSGPMAKWFLAFGLSMVLAASLLLVMGPLQLRWGTRLKADTIEKSVVSLIERRNARSLKYHVSSAILVVGLAGYVGSLLMYLIGL